MCENVQPKMDEYLKGLREKVRAEEPEEEPRGGRSLLEDLSWRLADQQDGQTKFETRLPKWAGEKTDDGYDSLRAIYAMALEQAQGGKGKERHANGQPFDQQPICQGGRRFGAGCLIYQAWKKAHETPVLMTMDNGTERAIRELLGVINYAAAAIIVLQEGK